MAQGSHVPQLDAWPKRDAYAIYTQLIGRPFVKRFVLRYRTVVCLSVTLVYCGKTLGWIKIICMEVGLGPGHIVLDRDPAPPKEAP